MWSRPIGTLLRSGFEITGYALARSKSSWSVPTATTLRSGFEVTGYALAIRR